jgi:exopolysaccharide biosynthesis WecB/TagA/CpsF family protein
MATTALPGPTNFRRILGIPFFQGSAAEAVDRVSRGGLLVVPAAPALKDLETSASYRQALLEADLAITDSAFMVMVWNRLQHDNIHRLSGLEYLRELLTREDARRSGNVLWVMPGSHSARMNVKWLRKQGVSVPRNNIYIAPMYGNEIEDESLLECIERLRPQHIVVTVGGGTQERLGLYLKEQLSYLPAIHCIGAAIGFLSGDQVHIPVWADRFYLGWLFRSLSQPKLFIPRYWHARKLYSLIRRYRDRLPGSADAAVPAISNPDHASR